MITPSKIIKNRNGNAIMYAMIISVVGAILVGSLTQYFATLSKTVFKSNDIGALRAALNSSMDYTMNGIRNRWCFSSTWTPSPVCKLTDDKNVERMMLSDEALRAIQSGLPAADYGGDISKVRTKSITGSIKWEDITPEHPLYYVVKGLKDIGKDFVFTFKIIRVDDGTQKGREVSLQVEVELQLGGFSLIKTSSNTLSVVSSIIVFPREINTNALLIANNLFLDRNDPGIGQADNGNVYIQPVQKPGIPGLHFDSPVFVNGNIYVPAPDTPVFTPVTFGDKVIIGGGAVLQEQGGTAGFSKPKTAGGVKDRFFAQTERFGGFLRGVLLDPGADEGLRVLGKVKTASVPANETDMCIIRNQAKVDLSLTREAQLFLKVTGANDPTATTDVTSSYSFQANLGSVDTFYRQGPSGSAQFIEYSNPELAPKLEYASAAGRPIVRVSFALNGYRKNPAAYVTADMSDNATLEVKMNPADPSAVLKITTSPYSFGTSTQANAVNLKVDLINQERFALSPYAVKLGGSELTTTAEPSIDVNLEAFDIAYLTDENGKITTGRAKGKNPLPPSDCENPSDSQSYNGVTYPCYSLMHWHPKHGGYKANGFILRGDAGPLGDKRLKLVRDASAPGVYGGYFTCRNLDGTCPAPENKSKYPQEVVEKDWAAFDRSCFTPPTGTDMFPSFTAASWTSASFTDQARRSWGFTEPGSEVLPGFNPGTLLLDGTNSRLTGAGTGNPVFMVSAIYNNCVIKSDANFVTGFFVCDNLTIEPRSEPLRIVGTFIVSKMSISSQAMSAGIRWSNIYYPTAVYELRKAGVLKASTSGEDCDVPTDPLWHPYPSIERVQFLFKCNPISLRNKADPFKWTLVDPDCGLVGNKQQCKYRVMRYDLVELKRQEFL